MSEKREQIINCATRMIRSGGYHSFSFREIADEIGVKSSSVHHYFRRKEDLAEAVADRYGESFFDALGPPDMLDRDLPAVIKHYGEVFLQAYRVSGHACLCGILSHESPAIPPSVNARVATFVERNIQWLESAFEASARRDANEIDVKDLAQTTYAALSGAMAVATLKADDASIEAVIRSLS